MVTVGRIRALATAIAAAFALTGCATTAMLPGRGAGNRPAGQDGPAADPDQVAVVRHWAAALRAGDLRDAAGYFHLPSVFDGGGGSTVQIHTLAQAEFVNSTLSCGAEVISAFRQGRYINVLFRLTPRAGRGGGTQACGSGVGETARAEMLVRDGRIYAWVRAPSRPGDPGPPTPTTPGSGATTGGTPV